MDVSVIIPSRNRPELLRRALESVLAQTHSSIEIIVVNDGSDGENEIAYTALAKEMKPKVRFFSLEHTTRGHGQSYAINRGVEIAQGKYVTFLDDDDFWTDPEHIARACKALFSHQADIFYTNQEAYSGEVKVLGTIWLEGLDRIIESHSAPDSDGVYTASVKDLMACKGFAHLNTSIIRRSLYLDINGMDENIRYECDWDFFLRSIDAAKIILFRPEVTSRHSAPDQTQSTNMSTVVSNLQKLLFRSYVLDKAVLFSTSPEIRKKARRHKIYTLKRISESLHREGKIKEAAFYSNKAAMGFFDIKWKIYSTYLNILSLA